VTAKHEPFALKTRNSVRDEEEISILGWAETVPGKQPGSPNLEIAIS